MRHPLASATILGYHSFSDQSAVGSVRSAVPAVLVRDDRVAREKARPGGSPVGRRRLLALADGRCLYCSGAGRWLVFV